MTTPREYDDERTLLAALGHRHANTLPLRASICLSAAVNDLTDSLAVPPLAAIDVAATSDPRAVIESAACALTPSAAVMGRRTMPATAAAVTWAPAGSTLIRCGPARTVLDIPSKMLDI